MSERSDPSEYPIIRQARQRKLLSEAALLAEENPEAEIHVLAASDEILLDYQWTGHVITRVELGWWSDYDERIFTNPDELRETMEEDLGREVSEEEALRWMRRAILISTRAG